MDLFRVYTAVYRVGVSFRIGDDEVGIPSAMVMLVTFMSGVGLAAGSVTVLHSTALMVIVIIVFVVLLAWMLLIVTRLNNMNGRDERGAKLRDTTQVMLLWKAVHRPVVVNFDTPDTVGGPIRKNY